MQQLLLIITATASGLIAGLFYAYSCSVIPGLGKLSDSEYMNAMQSINREIMNPVFFASFMGTLVLLPTATWIEYRNGISPTFYLLLGATLIYIIGGFGVTAGGNVPLNEILAKLDLRSASFADLAKYRKDLELPWNKLHQIRTVACIISFMLVIAACIKYGSKV